MKNSYVILVCALAIAVVVLPIIANPYLPLVDLPNHIARQYIAANPQSALNLYYDYEIGPTPNAAVDLLWIVTGHPFGAVRFSQLVMALYAANLVLSVMVLARVVHGKWKIWAAASGLLAYNATFSWGFQNFVFTVPFAIYGLALWFSLERRSNLLRAGVFIPFGLLLFWMHLFAFVLLAVVVLGRELQRVIEAGKLWPSMFRNSLPLAIPFLIPLVLLAYVMQTTPPNPAAIPIPTSFGALADRYYALVSPVSTAWAPEATRITPVGTFALGVLWLLFLCVLRRNSPRLQVARPMIGPLIALLILCVLTPRSINGVALVQIRFPFVFMAMVIAATQWEGLRLRTGWAVAGVVAAALIARGVEFHLKASDYSRDIIALETALEQVPPGARILPVRSPGHEDDTLFWHAQAYAIPMAEAFVPTLFQGVHLLRLKPEWVTYANPAGRSIDQRRVFEFLDDTITSLPQHMGIFWAEWQSKFTHVLLLDTPTNDLSSEPNLALLHRSGRFSLFEVLPD